MKKETLLDLIGMTLDGKSSVADFPFQIGKAYFIRTVTYHAVGVVDEIKGKFLILSESSWVADSGRFGNAIQKGELSEVEYVGVCFLNTTSIVDAFPWKHKLPKKTK